MKYRHRSAEIRYAFGHYKLAKEKWTSFAKDYPKTNETRDALGLLLKVSILRKDWKTTIENARAFLLLPGIQGSPSEAPLIEALKAAILQRASELEKTSPESSIQLYIGYQKEFVGMTLKHPKRSLMRSSR